MFRWIKFWCVMPLCVLMGIVSAVRNMVRLEREKRRARVNRHGLVCLPSGRAIPVTLRPAFVWLCDVCGNENFFAVQYRAMTERQAIAIAQREGVCGQSATIDDVPEAIREREIGVLPDAVRCQICHGQFAVDLSQLGGCRCSSDSDD